MAKYTVVVSGEMRDNEQWVGKRYTITLLAHDAYDARAKALYDAGQAGVVHARCSQVRQIASGGWTTSSGACLARSRALRWQRRSSCQRR